MSAAFDLLRPGIFHESAPIDSVPLMDILMDFMSNRTFVVKIDKSTSKVTSLNVGCVQGSVLGPKLFGIYCRGLPDDLPSDAKLITYADDSYVINSGITSEEVRQKTEASLESHITFLRSIGMVVNTSKTELLYSSRTNGQLKVKTETMEIASRDSLKALGIYITPNLSWDKQVDFAINCSNQIIKRIKFLTKFLNTDELLKLLTSQYFLIIYYGAPIWAGSVSAKSWTRVNSAHYRALRAALRDFKGRKKRVDLDKESMRATPAEWGRYIICSTTIKLYNTSDTNIGQLLRKTAYLNDRMPYRARFIDGSKLKIGRQSLPYRIGPLFANISFDWTNVYSDDTIRRLLKTEFFKYYTPPPDPAPVTT